MLRACGIRLSELAGVRYDEDDPYRSDLDLQDSEIRSVVCPADKKPPHVPDKPVPVFASEELPSNS